MSPEPGGERAEKTGSWRDGLSRRTFLRRGTFTAATVAAVSSVPGLSALVTSTASEAPAVETGATDAEMDSGVLAEPLVAHLKDLGTGEISLFQGEREITVRSPALARSLLSAARQ